MDELEAYRAANPYGDRVRIEEIEETLGLFDAWEDRYRYIIDLGKALPILPESAKVPENIVHGCQSQVWVITELRDGRLEVYADSDALIVRGLIAVVLSAFNRRSPEDVAEYDIEGVFARTGLLAHLSPTRGNGLRALVARIRALATEHA